MSSIDRHTQSVWLIGAASLCLALAAAPVVARACDMNAINQELAREEQAAPRAMAANTAADPSPNNDPSPNQDEKATSTQQKGQQSGGNGSAGTAQGGQSGAASRQKQ